MIIKGEARILVKSMEDNSLITIERKGQGSIIGWVGLLRGKACETIQVCKDIEAISIPSEVFVRLCITEQDFSQYFDERVDASETWDTLKEYFKKYPYQNKELDSIMKNACKTCSVNTRLSKTKEYENILSTDQCKMPMGSLVNSDDEIISKEGFVFKVRIIKLEKQWKQQFIKENSDIAKAEKGRLLPENEQLQVKKTDLYKLGIIEKEDLKEKDIYPVIKGNGMVEEGVAVIEMW